MSFSPVNNGSESPEMKLPRVTMCLDSALQDTQDAKTENMKVYARIRPMLQKEEDEGYRECIAAIDEEIVRALVPVSSMKYKNSSQGSQDVYDFKYSQAFGPDVGQFEFFQQTIMDIMQGFIEGQNCLIFNYGITNSGKTFTLQGDDTNPGIIPLAMHLFFGSIEHQLMDEISVKPEKYSDLFVLSDKEKARESRLKEELLRISDQESFNKTSADSTINEKSFSQILCDCFRDNFKFQTETTLAPEDMIAAQSALYMREESKKSADQQSGDCSIWVSFIEIYNEYIYDLLQPNINLREKLSLGEDQNGDVYVKGAREVCVANSTEAVKLLKLGRRNLRIASTKLNYQSSRSHCIFTVKVARVYDGETGVSGRVNRISFCDLAGSERATKSQASGMRLKEAGYINTSLMVLGRCLDQLRLNQNLRDKKLIPFRESKLTRLFSNHFLGKGKAVMVANASPCEYTFDETLNVLRFSALAKELTINDSYISKASSSLQNITNQWMKSKTRLSDVSHDQSTDFDDSVVEELQEKDEMIEKLLDLADSLRGKLEQAQKENAEMETRIRQDVCNEYAEYSDQLLDNQKKNFEDHIESVKELHRRRYETMENKYVQRINELEAELNEFETSVEESFESSVNKGNMTSNSTVVEEKLISFSPAVNLPIKKENTTLAMNSSMDCFDTVAEDDTKNNIDILSLKEDLEFVTKELEITKEKLEQTFISLKESKTEEAIVNEKCEALNCKLLEANQVLEEYQKEFEQMKAACAKSENEIESLLEEKKSLQDCILSLTEQLGSASTEAAQLKKDKLEVEESYSQQLLEAKKEIVCLEGKCKELESKLEVTIQAIEEEKSKFILLDTEYSISKNNIKTTAEDLKSMEEKLSSAVEQLDHTTTLVEQQKKEMNGAKEHYEAEKMKIQNEVTILEETCKELTLQLEESTSALNDAKSKCRDLEAENDNHKNSLEELKELKEKLIAISEKLGEATTETEKLKEDKLTTEKNFNLEKMKLLDEMDNLEQKYKELSTKLEECNQSLVKEKCNYEGLKLEYESYKRTSATFSNDVNSLKEKYTFVSEELGLATAEVELLKKEKLDAETNHAHEKKEILDEKTGLEEKCSELSSKLESLSKAALEEKSKFNNLEMEYEQYKNEFDVLAEDKKNTTDKFALLMEEFDLAKLEVENVKKEKLEIEEKYAEDKLKVLNDADEHKDELYKNISSDLEVANQDNQELKLKINELNLKIDELELSCASYKENNSELAENLKILKEKFTLVSDELEKAKVADEKYKELSSELTKITTVLQEEKSKVTELESKCAEHEKENAKLLVDIKEFEDKCDFLSEQIKNSFSDKTEELTSKLKEVTQLLEDKKSRVHQLEEKCSCLKSENAELLNNLESEKEKCARLSAEQASAISELEHLQKEIAVAMDLHCKTASELKTREIATQEKCNELDMKLKESSDVIETQKTKIAELEQNNIEFKNKNSELSENLKTLEGKCATLSKSHDRLVQVLEKCELCATRKIKVLHSSSIKNLEELTDMMRQIREKETSIEELERALCDSQKQVKESEARAKKQLHALKQQHSIEIEEMAHLKKLVEEENAKLKTAATEEIVLKRSSSDVSKGRKKRSLSDMSKDENDNKENSDQESAIKKEAKVKTEEQVLSKRRRVLRQRQPVVSDGDESKEESEEEYKPKATNRKKMAGQGANPSSKQVQKKTTGQAPRVPATRTSRRKLQEESENMSPVKKAMVFMGSKIRSVAQSVANVPSPRLTRGRKKLFNVDAGPSALDKKWKF